MYTVFDAWLYVLIAHSFNGLCVSSSFDVDRKIIVIPYRFGILPFNRELDEYFAHFGVEHILYHIDKPANLTQSSPFILEKWKNFGLIKGSG